jgi:hypothetical protein
MAGSHSLWGLSGAKRWRTCAGSVVFYDGAPDESSIYAAEGTCYHELAEKTFTQGGQASDAVGTIREADGFQFKITEEDADYAQEYVDRLRARANEHCIVIMEGKVDTSDVLGIPEQVGTIDACILDIANETIEIRDLKFGRGVKVYVWEDPGPGISRWQGINDQLGGYLLAAWRKYSFMCHWKKFRLVIDQPRLNHLDIVELTREEMEAFAESLWRDAQHSYGVWQAHREDAKHLIHHLAPSLEACRFCIAGGSCQRRAQDIMNLFPTPEQLKYMTEIPVTAKNLPTMSGKELAHALDIVEKAEAWGRAVRAEALYRAQSGSTETAPGWKLAPGRKGDRTYDADKAQTAVAAALEVSSVDKLRDIVVTCYTEPQFKSPAQLEKACKKLGDLGEKIWAAVSPLITQADGKPTLVRDFDARPELAPQAASFALRPADQEFTPTKGAAEGLI